MKIEYYMQRTAASPWMSIEELADRLQVSVRTIRRHHAGGIGPDRAKRSRKFMYRRDDVENWLAARKGQITK